MGPLRRLRTTADYAPQLMHSGGALPPSLSTVVFSAAAASAALASTVNLIASTAAFVRK